MFLAPTTIPNINNKYKHLDNYKDLLNDLIYELINYTYLIKKYPDNNFFMNMYLQIEREFITKYNECHIFYNKYNKYLLNINEYHKKFTDYVDLYHKHKIKR